MNALASFLHTVADLTGWLSFRRLAADIASERYNRRRLNQNLRRNRVSLI